MRDEVDRHGDVFQHVAAAIRSKLDELVCLAMTIDEELERLSQRQPELQLTLISDAILRQHQPVPSDTLPTTTIGVQIPGGVGLVLWRGQSSSLTNDARSELTFIPFFDAPPLLQRLLIPHLEQVLDGLRQRLGR